MDSQVRVTSAYISRDLNGARSSAAKLNCGVLCVTSLAFPLSKVGEFSTFPAATHTSANRVAATQPELANEVVDGGGTNSEIFLSESGFWFSGFESLNIEAIHRSARTL